MRPCARCCVTLAESDQFYWPTLWLMNGLVYKQISSSDHFSPPHSTTPIYSSFPEPRHHEVLSTGRGWGFFLFYFFFHFFFYLSSATGNWFIVRDGRCSYIYTRVYRYLCRCSTLAHCTELPFCYIRNDINTFDKLPFAPFYNLYTLYYTFWELCVPLIPLFAFFQPIYTGKTYSQLSPPTDIFFIDKNKTII